MIRWLDDFAWSCLSPSSVKWSSMITLQYQPGKPAQPDHRLLSMPPSMMMIRIKDFRNKSLFVTNKQYLCLFVTTGIYSRYVLIDSDLSDKISMKVSQETDQGWGGLTETVRVSISWPLFTSSGKSGPQLVGMGMIIRQSASICCDAAWYNYIFSKFSIDGKKYKLNWLLLTSCTSNEDFGKSKNFASCEPSFTVNFFNINYNYNIFNRCLPLYHQVFVHQIQIESLIGGGR